MTRDVDQVLLLLAAQRGYMDNIDPDNIRRFEKMMLDYLHTSHSTLVMKLAENLVLDNQLASELEDAINEANVVFVSGEYYGRTDQ